MDPREFLSFVRRHFLSLFLVGVLFFGVGMGLTRQASVEEGATVFLTIGAVLTEGVSMGTLGASQNENVVDQFTQTVQGWVSNPGLVQQVAAQLDRPFDLSVRKQEKQNLIVTLEMNEDNPGEATPELGATVFLEVLNRELMAYNERTNSQFVVAISSVSYFKNSPHFALNGVIALFLGLVVGLVTLALREYVKRTLTFEFQAVSVLGGAPLVRLKSGFGYVDLEGFVRLYASRHDIVLLEAGDTGMSAHRAYLKEARLDLLTYPAGLSHLNASEMVVAVVRLGVSSEDDVRALSSLYGKALPYLLIV